MAFKYDEPILARFVNWKITSGRGPKDLRIPEYSPASIKKRNKLNGSNFPYKRLGLFTGDDGVARIYSFEINIDKNGNDMISDDHYISLPCPDFCDAYVGTRVTKLVKGKPKIEGSFVVNLPKAKLSELNNLYRKYFIYEGYLSDVNNLFNHYDKRLKNIEINKINKYERLVQTTLFSFVLHQYQDTLECIRVLNKKFKNYYSTKTINNLFNQNIINNRLEAKKNLLNSVIDIKITILRCDNDFEGIIYPWNDGVYNSIIESSLRRNNDTKKRDYLESFYNLFWINQMYSNQFSNYKELVDSIPDDSQFILLMCHGNEDQMRHYYKDGSFKGKAKKVNSLNFINYLNKRKSTKIDHLIVYSCDATNILNLSKFKITIGSKGAINEGQMIAYNLSFFGSFILSNGNPDYKRIHKISKQFTSFISQSKNSLTLNVNK